jgi:uncharacterized protein YegL
MSEPGSRPRRPGGQMASRPLHFIWLVDGSGSMGAFGKMTALNQAIREAIPQMQAVARENPQVAIYVNVIRFGDDARWMVERLTQVAEFRWPEIEAGGVTAMGEALRMVGDALQAPLIRGRAMPPILALVTDGLPTDDFQAGLEHLTNQTWGRRAVRLVVGLGEDAATGEAQELLRTFVSEGAPAPMQANDPATLEGHIRWISTAAVKAVCAPELAAPQLPTENPNPEPLIFATSGSGASDEAIW